MVMIHEKGGARVLAHDQTSRHHPCINLSAEAVQLSPEMRDGAMGREHGERKAGKGRRRSGTQSAYFFPNISCCSSGLPSRSALGGLRSRGTSS